MLLIIVRMKRVLRELWISNVGGVLIYLAFGMPILLGAMALSIDLGRSFILNTELKDFSDAAALAGAFELDRTDGARARAEDAARTGLRGTLLNVQAFATDGGGPNIAIRPGQLGIVLLRNLPADGTNFTANDTATSDQDAAFIFVSVVNRNVRSGLSRGLGIIPDFDTGARSIAGRGTTMCEVPAMFMCNPLEDIDFPVPVLTPPCVKREGAPLLGQEDCLKGRLMQLRMGGPNKSKKDPGNPNKNPDKNSYFPGEFGLLECPGFGKGAKEAFRCIAEARPPICVSQFAYVKTGVVAMKIANAINLRFDLYGPGVKKSYKNDFDFRPALNVTKGYEPGPNPNDCPVKPDPGSTNLDSLAAFPRDLCFAPGATPRCGRWGDNDWQDEGGIKKYWEANHGNKPESKFKKPPKFSEDWTRFDFYRHEVNSELGLEEGPGIPELPDSKLENGKTCNYKAGDPNDPKGGGFSDPALNENDLDRRLLTLAVVNCIEHGPLTGASSNNKGGVPIEGFVEVFLTEPAGLPNEKTKEDKKDIWGEVARIVGNDDRLKVIVQLYR